MHEVIIKLGITAIATSVTMQIVQNTEKADLAPWIGLTGTCIIAITALSKVNELFTFLSRIP